MSDILAADALDQVISGRMIRTVFQPIVDLDSGSVVAYEALSRGPEGPLEAPDRLFDIARAVGRLTELDELCRRTALESAIAIGMFAPLTLFVNVEPAVLDSARLEELVLLAEQAPGELQVVLEITERAIGERPAQLLATVSRLRAAGWRIALDDVGADDMSLAFMPLLRPDIVKLDLSLVQKRPGPAVAEIMNAVNAYAERSGAVLLAEGIEDEKHLEIARALGARLGQGWMFGRPSVSLSEVLPVGGLDLPPAVVPTSNRSPFGCLPPEVPLRRSTKPLLIELSKFLEREAIRFGSTCLVVAAFQEAKHFTADTAHRYRELVGRVGFVAAIGQGLGPEPVCGLRGADLDPDDPMRSEWNVIVLAPHFAAALLARDLGDRGPDPQRRFEFALTYDRATVVAAAHTLLSRVRSSGLPESTSAMAGQLPPPRLTGMTPDSYREAVDSFAQFDVRLERRNGTAETTLRRALAATTNGVTIADVTRPDHPLIYVNTAFERLSGLRAEDVLGSNCRVLQGQDTDPEAIRRIREAIADGREARETILNHRGPDHVPWWNVIFLAPVFDDDARLVQYIGVQNDVTAKVEADEQLLHERRRSAHYLAEVEALAFRDPLTGLLNRRRLQDLLESAVLHAQVNGTGLALLYLDVDHFKSINDRHGHAAGDAVLTATASRLQARLRRGDLIARLGGDEFLVMLPGLDADHSAAEAQRIAGQCLTALVEPIELAGGSASVTVSIGVSSYPDDGDTFDALVHAADQRMYATKPTRTWAN